MSSEHQHDYSTRNRTRIIEDDNVQRGIEIIKTHADDGKSRLAAEQTHQLKHGAGAS